MKKYVNPIGTINNIKVYEYQCSDSLNMDNYAIIELLDGKIKKVKLLKDRIPDRWYFKINDYRYPLSNMIR